jgi:peptidyl-prolyl cis-trans isomerase C
MKYRRLVVPVIAQILVAGCGQSSSPSMQSTSIATVGGLPISQGLFDFYVRTKTGASPDKIDPKLKAALLEDLKRLKAAATIGAVSNDSDTAQALELERLEWFAHAGASKAGVYAPPTDTELHVAYDAFVAAFPAREYHVAHILVATENMANLALVKIQAGVEFAKLAREESADDSKALGGDLGWIVPGKLPNAFMDAVRNLKPGEVAPKPVHTLYGWHLIKLLEIRSAPVPGLDQLKAQLVATLQHDKYKKFLDESLKSAELH